MKKVSILSFLFFIGFSSKGIKKVLDFFFNNPIYLPIDHDLHYIKNIIEYSLADDWITVDRNSFSDTINQ